MSEHTKLLRIYTDEAAYYGDRKVLEVSHPRRVTPDSPA